MVKNLPAMWEGQVQSLGWEDSLEKGTAAHSSILAWIIPWTEEFLMNLALMAMPSQTFSIYLAIQTVLKHVSVATACGHRTESLTPGVPDACVHDG